MTSCEGCGADAMREGQDLLEGEFCYECAAMHLGVALAGNGKAYKMEKVNDHIVNGMRGAASRYHREMVIPLPEHREGGLWEDKKNRDAQHWERKYRELADEKLKWGKEREHYREKLKKRTAQRTKALNELSKVDRNWGALDQAKEDARQAKMKLNDLQGDYDKLARKVHSQASRIEYLTTNDPQVVYKKAWEEEHYLNVRLGERIKELEHLYNINEIR